MLGSRTTGQPLGRQSGSPSHWAEVAASPPSQLWCHRQWLAVGFGSVSLGHSLNLGVTQSGRHNGVTVFPGQGASLKVTQRWWLWEEWALDPMGDSQVAHMGFLGTILPIGTGYIESCAHSLKPRTTGGGGVL